MRALTIGRKTLKTEKNRRKQKRSTFQASFIAFNKCKVNYLNICDKDTTGKSPGKPQTPRFKSPLKRIKTAMTKRNLSTPSKSPSSKKFRRAIFSSGQDQNKENIKSLNNDASDSCDLINDLLGDVPITEGDELQQDIDQMIDLVPSVMENLSKEGHAKNMLRFFQLTNEDKFPLQNISLQLWLEVVKWFGCDNATEMRYSESTKKFWKLGYRLFGGQFLCFMSGPKSSNSVVLETTEKGLYPPSQSTVNFAVPGKQILSSFTPFSSGYSTTSATRPGILTCLMEQIATTQSEISYCVTFDGKKLKRGLTESSGDVDMLGFETGPTLQDRRDQLNKVKQPICEIIEQVHSKDENTNISELREEDRHNITKVLKEQLQKTSLNVIHARDLRKKKEYGKAKLIERSGGSDWKNGKYVFAISSLIAFIHDIDDFLQESLVVIDEIIICIGVLNNAKVISNNEIDLGSCENYTSIQSASEQASTRQIRQRSDEWFDRRKKMKVTGSTIYAALGLDGLARQKEHFDITVGKLKEKPKPEHVMNAMAHGIENESNAAATVVGKVLPVLCPGSKMYEEGFVELDSYDNMPFMIVSPDGSVRSADGVESTTMGIELKCPIYDVQTSLPSRYMLQCLSEIEALNVSDLIYLCWRPDISTVFKIKRNSELFQKAFKMAEALYVSEKPRRPTRVQQESKALQDEIKKACTSESTVEFIGVFPSVTHKQGVTNIYSNDTFLIRRLEHMLDQILSNYDRFHELQRVPATEAVVFLCCDLDRKWDGDKIQAVPVCWFPKGSSLDTPTMRRVEEAVLDKCKEKGLHVPAVSFDGQWHNIAVRDTRDRPLTTLQLQKDIWKRVEKISKQDILKHIEEENKTVKRLMRTFCTGEGTIRKSIVCTNGGRQLPKISKSIVALRLKGISVEQHTYDAEAAETEELIEANNQTDTDTDCTSQDVVQQHVEIDDTEKDSSVEYSNSKVDGCTFDAITSQKATVDTNGHTSVDFSNVSEVERVCGSRDQQAKKDTVVNVTVMASLLDQLKLDKQANMKNQWNNESVHTLLQYFVSADSLRKFRDVELRVVVRFLSRTGNVKMKESAKKETKVLHICSSLGIEYTNIVANPMKKTSRKINLKQPKLLSDIALRKVNSCLKKKELSIIYAELLWPNEYKKWYKENSDSTVAIPETEQFYFPAYSQSRKQQEVSCIDSSHLLTRMRRKSAKGGLDGLSNEPWRKVAKSQKTALTLGMVDCILEPMTVSVANTHFSERVEMEMRLNGDKAAADLCKDVRQWWRAEDEAGIPAEQRVELRASLRARLLNHVDFAKFPPPGAFINGWPMQLWEAIIASIDAKRILYSLTKNHAYNVRAFSSMMGETFFSELTLYDRRGQGTVTAKEFGQYIDTTIEKLHMRLDPNRTFSYMTSQKKVYKLVGQYGTSTSKADSHMLNDEPCSMRDHEFDDPGRLRVKPKKKEATQETSRNAIARGSLGVRWESARRNESKLLPTYRLGIDMDNVK